jgi:hypothetical protein
LADRRGTDLLDAGIINIGPNAYRRADGIGVVPLALLGPGGVEMNGVPRLRRAAA